MKLSVLRVWDLLARPGDKKWRRLHSTRNLRSEAPLLIGVPIR
jgi:hypothetical protein